MNQRKDKKVVKNSAARQIKPKDIVFVVKPRPDSIRITIGKYSKFLPYVDNIDDIISLETNALPIVHMSKKRKGTVIISKLLKRTGVEPLVEIGDEILGRF